MTALPLILDYPAAAAAGPALAGGKGAQLGLLARYGLPVPEGFVLSALAGDDQLAAALPEVVRQRGWERIPLAVRSSATQEDSRQASFAGIHHSALNVIGADAVVAAARAVRASLHTPQAEAYRQRLGLDATQPAMAVVVMPMVPAVAAGVAFSCDPRSGRDDQVVINAVPGLADALVAGKANGEEIVLAADPVTEEHRVVSRSGPAAGLDDARAVELADLVRDAAFALDYAAPWYDIEWVWDGERFHLVQGRPVTARPWHTYPALSGQPPVWTNGNTRDVLPHVLDAADWSTARRMVNLLLEQGWRLAGYPLLPGAQRAALFAGRLYLNASFIQWEGYDALGVAPAAMNRLLGGHHPEMPVPSPTLCQRIARFKRLLAYLARTGKVRRAGSRQVDAAHAACAAWRRDDLAALTDDQLAARLGALGPLCLSQYGLMFLQSSSGGTLSLLLDLIDRHLPGESHALAAALMAGGEESTTARQGYELMALAAAARRDPVAGPWLRAGESDDWQALPGDNPFRQGFAAILERYGHRGIYESYLRSPRWRETPGYLLRQVAALMDQDPAALRARQEKVRTDARIRLATAMPRWARLWTEALARSASQATADRENARSAFTAYGEVARLLLLEAGRRLVARGDLEAPADVFHLTRQEMLRGNAGQTGWAGLRRRIADRKRQIADWEANPAPEVVHEGAVACAPPSAPRRGNSWQGTAVGAGRASGPARPIHHPDDGHRLAPGDILVAPATDPAWTPLFLRAGGLVMETGGYLSHGAIVAREFGIPAVVNLPGILAALPEGATVEVDGRRGTVRKISD
jgi:pyruvate,water dikinase